MTTRLVSFIIRLRFRFGTFQKLKIILCHILSEIDRCPINLPTTFSSAIQSMKYSEILMAQASDSYLSSDNYFFHCIFREQDLLYNEIPINHARLPFHAITVRICRFLVVHVNTSRS